MTRAEGRTEIMGEPCSYPGCTLLYLHPGPCKPALSPEVAELVSAAEELLAANDITREAARRIEAAIGKVRARCSGR